jgi:hypothetical protein
MDSIQSLYDDVEKFIREFDTMDVIVTDKAEDIRVFELGEGALGRETKKDIGSLRSVLPTRIAEYRANKHNPIQRLNSARELYHCIELARSNHVLEYPYLSAKAQKFNELEKAHEKLKSEHDKLIKMYNDCIRAKDKLEKDIKLLHALDTKHNKHDKDGFIDGGVLANLDSKMFPL